MPQYLHRVIVCLAATVIFLLPAFTIQADLITISTSTPTGDFERKAKNKFLGILETPTGATPPEYQLAGEEVEFDANIPAGESFLVGDLVGRDIDGTDNLTAPYEWTYELTLPGDAVAGTGFQDIIFDAHAFVSNKGKLEADDTLTWELFLNNDFSVVVASDSVFDDFPTFIHDVLLTDAGGSTINQVNVVFTVEGYDKGDEWFATRGLLSATYTAVPEPGSSLFLLATGFPVLVRRRV